MKKLYCILLLALGAVACLEQAGGSNPAEAKRAAAPALPGAAASTTAAQRAYLATCNRFAWKGDRVRCEAGENNTLKIYQEMRPAEGSLDPNSDAYFDAVSDRDTVKYILNHREKMKAIHEAGFDTLEMISTDPTGNAYTLVSVQGDGTFRPLRNCWDGTDGRLHCGK